MRATSTAVRSGSFMLPPTAPQETRPSLGRLHRLGSSSPALRSVGGGRRRHRLGPVAQGPNSGRFTIRCLFDQYTLGVPLVTPVRESGRSKVVPALRSLRRREDWSALGSPVPTQGPAIPTRRLRSSAGLVEPSARREAGKCEAGETGNADPAPLRRLKERHHKSGSLPSSTADATPAARSSPRSKPRSTPARAAF